MTVEQLQAKYPDATITAGIGALHYQRGDTVIQIMWGLGTDRAAVVADMDAKIAALSAV